jgi:HAD superfamily phosphoserine phosphatase-like hydrolase
MYNISMIKKINKVHDKVVFFDFDGTLVPKTFSIKYLEYLYKHDCLSFDIVNDIKLYFSKSDDERRALYFSDLPIRLDKLIAILINELKNQDFNYIKDLTRAFIQEHISEMYIDTPVLFEKFKDTHDIYIITANIHFLAEALTSIFNLNGYMATKVPNSQGTIAPDVAMFHSKEKVLDILQLYSYEDSFAFGDSYGDVSMLNLVKYKICINPDKYLSKYAKENGFIITSDTKVVSVVDKLL